jgi:glycosyltransferase involved in cell wall biosynthesis
MNRSRAVDLLVPGDLRTLSGGYLYDSRIMDGLARLGWATAVHRLDASFPEPGQRALAEAERVLAAVPDEHAVVVDGLALPGLVPALERDRRPERVVALFHHPVAYETGLAPERARRLFERECAALALVGRVIVTGQWTRRELAAFGVDDARITVVEPGTEPAPRATGSGGVPRMICVASLTARKGHETLLDALATLRDLPWQLWCAGSETREPETARRVRAQAERAGLAERIEWLGELAPGALGARYDACDVFVLASYLEGYGMAIAEALARGLPIVSTRAGAIPDTVPEGAGVLVPPGDAAALAEALRGVLADRAALERLARAADFARAGLPTWDDATRAFGRALERAPA